MLIQSCEKGNKKDLIGISSDSVHFGSTGSVQYVSSGDSGFGLDCIRDCSTYKVISDKIVNGGIVTGLDADWIKATGRALTDDGYFKQLEIEVTANDTGKERCCMIHLYNGNQLETVQVSQEQ